MKHFKKAPAKPDEVDHVRIPVDLWREMCIAATRYAYARSIHPQPQRFDAAVDEGIKAEHDAALAASSLAVQ